MFPPLKTLIACPQVFNPDKEIGIEIEVEGRYLDIKRNRTWHQKADGSLRGDDNREYILIYPVEKKNVRKNLQKLVNLLNFGDLKDKWLPAELEPSDRCGVHVHINVQHMTFYEVFNFMFLYLMFEKVLVGYCGESREGNMFCLRASDAEAFIDRMIECKKYSDLYRLQEGRGKIGLRYASMNPGAIFKFGSLEFRALRTPQDLLKIEEWVNILYQIKIASFNFDDPITFIELYSMRGEDRFFDDMMGPMANILRKKVRDVDQKLLDGIRLTQDIAYTPTDIHPQTNKELGLKNHNHYEEVALIEGRPRRREYNDVDDYEPDE